MQWLYSLLTDTSSYAHNMLVYSLVISCGLYAGRKKIGGIALGSTCVLFLGLIVSFLGIHVGGDALSFMRNFGLTLFVFSIGLEVGPSFFATFRNGGVGLNALMIAGVLVSIAVTLAAYFAFFKGSIPLATMLGVHFGAVTSTPGLGAASEALHMVGNNDDIAVGYACAYPLAVFATISVIVILRKVFKVDLAEEERKIEQSEQADQQTPIYFHVVCTNNALSGLTLRDIRRIIHRPFICSRVLHEGVITSPTADTVIGTGDTLRIVATPDHKQAIVAFCGQEAKGVDLATEHSPLISRFITVTRSEMNGVKIDALHLSHFDGVNITRVMRAGATFFPYNSLRLQLGDKLFCVGPSNAVARLEALMGNRTKQLEKPNVVAIFMGIALSMILANVPIYIPGMTMPIRLGVAGGPLIVAILLGYFGPRFHMVTYTTHSANLMLREWGLAFFLASIGLASGDKFFEAILYGHGLVFVALGLVITFSQMLSVGIVGRKVFKLNFHTLAGLLAGLSTNTPSLSYASSLSDKSSAVIAYSTVYPFAMFMRILSGQVLVLALSAFLVQRSAGM